MQLKFHFLIETAFYLPLVPAVLAGFKWKIMQLHQRWFAILLWATFAISISSRIWVIMTDYNNMPFFHGYILVELILFLLVFKYMFNQSIKDFVWWTLAGGFLIVWLFNIFLGQGWWGFPGYVHAAEALIILTLVGKWFLKMLREKNVANPEKTFEFWMCTGLLLFFTGNFLLFLFPKFLIDAGEEVFNAIWMVNGILILLLYISYTIALLWVKKIVK